MWSRLRAERCLYALLLLTSASFASADVFRGGEFRIVAGEQAGTLAFSALIPASLAEQTELGLPEHCSVIGLERHARADRIQLDYTLACNQALSASDRILAPWRLDAVRVTLAGGDAPVTLTLTRASGDLAVPLIAREQVDRSWRMLAVEFTRQGVVHIGLGWDHLAFLLCLCLMFQGVRLGVLITAFTLGHSLSLGLAFFEVLTVPMPPVEAIIALSIVLMAREALRDDERGFRRPVLIVTGFGLLHGLGFASALGELGVGHAERWPALLFFNLGVELGQIAFVLAILGIAVLLGRLVPLAAARVAVLYGVGVVGAFWGFERVAAFTAI
jgi:hypothetical protein